MANVTETLAAWICSARYEDFPDAARAKANDVVFDSVGAMAACSTLPEVAAIVRLLEKLGGNPRCSVIGHALVTSVVSAAMANGAMAHGDEADPVHLKSAGGHVAAGVVPTALAVGEWLDKSGQELLHAVVLGYELGGRLMPIFYRERNPVARRFYPTAVVGSLASAVTAGVLLGFNREQMQIALCLAAYQAAGPDNMIKDPMHMGKTFQAGCANRNGVTAALLTADGCRAPLDILDGSHSLFDAFFGAPDAGAGMADDLGKYFSITDVMHKRYPVGSPNQTYLQALFALLKRHRVRPDDIAQIEVEIPHSLVQRIPTSRHASISGLSVCAIAAAKGKLDFYFLHDPACVHDPAVLAMQQRLKFVGRDDWQWLEHGRHAIVRIETRSGETLREEVWLVPMTRPELEDKFEDLVVPRFGTDKSARLARLLTNLAGEKSVRPLMHELRAG
ncbi:MAG TPA: MmgE/PrpD family protein [Burkholderiales bacterium]|nr:MmgE/PrpD family protein [Burkholderiales bacterium]